jgi:2-polyprenyl-6-methoxyphenol hydroxylase-like FAD-dependent oxidoreductase
MQRIEVPVLIVGAGPTGMMTGLLLRRLGVAALIVERRSGPQRAPAAHVVNARTFEVCRQAGVDMGAIAAAATSPADAGFTYWVTKLGGEVLGQLPFECQGDETLSVTPTPLRNLAQHRFEPILLDALTASGATPQFGHSWMSAEADDEGVTSRLSDVAGGAYEVRSRYLVAADGAGSPVRKWLGVVPVGPERIQSFVMIHFEANLRRLVRDCPGVLYWVCEPDCMGTFVAHDIDRDWVFMHPYDADRESEEYYTPERCTAMVRCALAATNVDFRIRTISTWVMTCQVAERYREGRVFLGGDAAHRFPPTGGLGLNTGVQDAHNLAWKLAMVLRGEAPVELLDSYEAERRPVAQYNAEQSLRNAARLMEVPRALGFTDDPEAARRNFAAILADPGRRREVGAAIDDQAEHFDMLGLQLGFSYEHGAILPDGSPRPKIGNVVREYLPSSRPGSRLPHGWLGRRSSLDLIPLDRLTLLVGAEGNAWLQAADALGVRIERIRIGVDVPDQEGWWTRVVGMGAGGVLLVRPDQHIAFRARDGVEDHHEMLRRAVDAALGVASRRSETHHGHPSPGSG